MPHTSQVNPDPARPGPIDSAALTLLHELFPGRLAPSDRWGLGKVRALLATAGHPEQSFPAIHVGGTNGKGSVSAMVDSVLRTAGLEVGLYTSPHLVRFNERIRVSGVPVTDDVLARTARGLASAVDEVNPAFFELATAVALSAFRDAHVDVAVMEVGLGGRLDATNVVQPLVTAVTNIGLDHSDLLGETYASVAREKAGIAKPDVPFLTTEADPEVRRVLCERAEALGGLHKTFQRDQIRWVEQDGAFPQVEIPDTRWGPLRFRAPLRGGHQALNVLLATRMLECAPEAWGLSGQIVQEGFACASWPGRLDFRTARDRTWLFDIAHNPEGTQSLLDALPILAVDPPLTLLFGVLADKNWRSMLRVLAPVLGRVVLCEPPSVPPSRRWNPAEALAWLEDRGIDAVWDPDFAGAVDRVAGGEGPLLVTGSVHTVGDAFVELGIEPFP